MNINDYKNIYFVGIKGVGMSMLAQFLKEKGFFVSGSDVADSFPSDKSLINAKINFKSGFSLDDFPEKIDLVIRSSAFSLTDNIELKYFKDKAIPMISYAEALGLLSKDYFTVSVCGSHGKTTVTSCLGYVLRESGLSPNVLNGSYVEQFKGSALIGDSDYLVVESDEYQNKLRYIDPWAMVLNNIDFDHPDYFENREKYFETFNDFARKISEHGFLVFNLDNDLARKVALNSSGRLISYSLRKDSEDNASYKKYRAENVKILEKGQGFDLFCGKDFLGEFEIKFSGRYNIYNSLAVIATALELGAPLGSVKKALESFLGPKRRFDVLGEYKGAVIIDDYAHHPSEIKAVLEASKERYPDKKINVIFHPHTFSRTEALIKDFSESFSLADDLYIIEIYSSAREKKSELSSLDLISRIKEYNKNIAKEQKVEYLKDINFAEEYLKDKIKKDEVFIFMGAGDVFKIPYNWMGISY
jgi:UDP-N-acetylmuramate--alanine ligase